jgi:hypothetical protein
MLRKACRTHHVYCLGLEVNFYSVSSFALGVCVCVATWAQPQQPYRAIQLVDLYAQGIERVDDIAANFVSEISYSGAISTRGLSKEEIQGTLFRSGDRIDIRKRAKLFWPSSAGGVKTAEWRRLIDQDYRATEAGDDLKLRYLSVSRNSGRLRPAVLNLLDDAATLDGVFHGSTGSMVEILRSAKILTANDELEDVHGHETYVLSADTAYGEYTLWLDPAMGFVPRRIKLTREADDLYNGEPMGTPPEPLSADVIATWPQESLVQNEILVDDIRIEEIGDLFVPIAATIANRRQYISGKTLMIDTIHRRFDIETEPDFEALGAFNLVIPDGTLVAFEDERGSDGIEYMWRGGAIVPKVDMSVFESIEQEISSMSDNLASQPDGGTGARSEGRAPSDTQTGVATSNTNKRSSNSRLFFISAVVGAVIVLPLVLIGLAKFTRSA